MGRGIAVVFAYAGHPVTVVDFKPRPRADFDKLAGDAIGEVRRTLASLAKLGLFDESAVEAIARASRSCRKARPAPLCPRPM